MGNIQRRTGKGEVIGMMVRLPRDLRDEVKAKADEVGRSVNTHVVMTLRSAMAAGAEIGVHTPAAQTTDQSGQEAV